jgi:hypothetical protein
MAGQVCGRINLLEDVKSSFASRSVTTRFCRRQKNCITSAPGTHDKRTSRVKLNISPRAGTDVFRCALSLLVVAIRHDDLESPGLHVLIAGLAARQSLRQPFLLSTSYIMLELATVKDSTR